MARLRKSADAKRLAVTAKFYFAAVQIQWVYFEMGLSKKDMGRRKSGFKAKLDELEKKAAMDPLHRDTRLHDEIAELKKKLAELE